ncbi:MAG TPA: type I secretion system permease/ATPase [Methylibium sp.]|nr:type I secretion system permease/ATPase [Methylibium sp.]
MSTSFVSALRQPLGTALGFSLAINLALLTPSLFMLQVFDRVFSTRSVETLVMLTIIATATLVTMGFLEHYRSRTLAAVGIALEQQHGPRLLTRLLGTPGGAQAEGMRDLGVLRSFLSGTGIVALFDAPWILIYLVVIYLFHPVLGGVATLAAGFLLLLAWLNERLTRDSLAALHDGHRDAARFVDDALRKSETVTALGMAGAVTARWNRMTRRSHGVQLGVSQRGGLFGAVSRVSRQMVQIIMLGVGAYLVIAEGATAGVTLAATIILGRALAPVELLIGGWKSLVDARAAYARLQPLLDAADEGPALTPLPRPSGKLEVENLVYTPPGAARPVVAGVSLSLQPGQVLAVVGASGSGKTTLARLLVGVLPPAYGGVRLDGADLRMWAVADRGRWLGYMPQTVALFPGTVSENIARLGEVDADALLDAARLAGAHEMILRLPQGYDTPVGEDGSRLSGGQRQRVALARAVYATPALVVLDEPDASLDAEGEQALLECVRQLRARGSTVVVVSQRRAVLGVADMVAVMKDGKIERLAAREQAAPVTSMTNVARGNLA